MLSSFDVTKSETTIFKKESNDSIMINFYNGDNCEKLKILSEQSTLTNYYLNKMIPEITRITHIESSAQKGYYGYLYRKNSLFKKDIRRWKKALRCNF
jgi:hypothetical protein